MSFKITRAAIHNPSVYGLHKLVLIILADHEGADFGSWPSVARIGAMAGISTRHAQRILRDLEEQGEIRVEKQGGHRGTNRYFVIKKVIHRGDMGVRGGDMGVTQGVTWVSPEHIKKPKHGRAQPEAVTSELNSKPDTSTKGFARSGATPQQEQQDTPNYLPPRCAHNKQKSALKCKQCSTQFAQGEIE